VELLLRYPTHYIQPLLELARQICGRTASKIPEIQRLAKFANENETDKTTWTGQYQLLAEAIDLAKDKAKRSPPSAKCPLQALVQTLDDRLRSRLQEVPDSLNELEGMSAAKDVRHRKVPVEHGQDPAPVIAADDNEPQSSDDVLTPVPAARCGPPAQRLILTPLQSSILRSLDRKALKKEKLAEACELKDGSRLYRQGGIHELRDAGLVAHRDGVGYYRPDAPPPNAVQLGQSLISPQSDTK
jgi:hypothetical protein